MMARLTHTLAAGAAIGIPALAHAGAGSQTWLFDETTTGEDVSWTSPTAVDPSAPLYEGQVLISLVEVDVTWLGIPFNNVDVTGQVPPDLLGFSAYQPGPAPLVLSSSPLEYPGPPDPPCLAALLDVELDAAGLGHLLGTGIVLGSCQVDLGFGIVAVELQSVRIAGQITISALTCPWDLDGNGDVGVTDLLAMLAAWGTPALGPPDMDGDGFVGVTDLLALLGHWGGCPERA